ncbi:MAG: UDP-N-acetylmuramoyl-tripeptide--D-alanyl-D-alanine ligase [Micrococcales bacterium]|nr:UDP-N-acetylmuramoyl-tripeptide--D-alanyl-D-alanine ligase [Micrococcales bacterium]
MIPLPLAGIAERVSGRLVLPAATPQDTASGAVPIRDAAPVSGSVQTDSRLVEPGSVFVAMHGAETDGHLFAGSAAAAGAALVIDERELELPVPQIVVSDAVVALAALARTVVAELRASGGLDVVGITGSNGKTTTKNLLAAILAADGPTVAPTGSFNNHVGMPVTMLRADERTRHLVLEMGAGQPGDIARLVGMVMPDIAVVLKVGMAHAGMFGGVEEVRREKAGLVTGLPATAVAVLNTDDPRVEQMAGETRARVVRFGLSRRADVRAEDIEVNAGGTRFTVVADGIARPVRLRILGEHHVGNALAALAVARERGLDLDRAIQTLGTVARAERWRMEVLERGDGVTVINDAYNASPDSTAAALKTLAELTAGERRSIAVIGEMAELGEFSDEEHDRIGRLAVRLNIAQLIVVGDGARHIHHAAGLEGSWDGESVLVPDHDAAYAVLREVLRPGDVVLVKSSKSAGLRVLGDRIAASGPIGDPVPGDGG